LKTPAAKTGTVHTFLLPEGWPQPRGYSNGAVAEGRMVFTGGLIGWDQHERLAVGLVAQVRQTLANVLAVLAVAGAGPEHIVRMTWYVRGMDQYRGSRKEIGAAWREIMGPVYPPMALVEVVRLVEEDALVEIETTAVIPEGAK
jgi:enamine deaminase RidA (YjgF/YER057c/UK114 family)